jgi:hypothetical protein
MNNKRKQNFKQDRGKTNHIKWIENANVLGFCPMLRNKANTYPKI